MKEGRFLVHAALFAVGAFLLLGVACSSPSTAPETMNTPPGGCRDRECPLGQECDGSGCVPVRPTLYPHIQLASVLLRPYVDDTEIDWRAQHYDLDMGFAGSTYADRILALNPNARLFEYTEFRYHIYEEKAEEWAPLHGYSAEDFFLHYREDVDLIGYGSTVLVPGFPPAFVPGWNPGRGPDDPPASATERSQSRIFGTPGTAYVPWRLANINDPGYRLFHIDWAQKRLDGSALGPVSATGPVDGLLIDHAIYYPMFNEGLLDKTDEFYGLPLDDSHPYALGFVDYFGVLQEGLAERMPGPVDLIANLGHIGVLGLDMPYVKATLEAVDWVLGEVWIMHRAYSSPTSGSARTVTYESDYGMAIADVVRESRAGRRCILNGMDLSAPPSGSERGKLFTLALYYLVHNPNTFFMYESCEPPPAGVHMSQWHWNTAVQYDIGAPTSVPAGYIDFEGETGTSEHYELATGPDPYDSTLTYHVFSRRFTKGMVLVKMLPAGSVVDDRSATTHVLDRPYLKLRADGTPGTETVTEVSIRNNEGIILVLP